MFLLMQCVVESLVTRLSSWACMISMHQLEGECKRELMK